MLRGQTAYSVIYDIIMSDEYAQMTDAEKAKVINEAYTYADQVAKDSISSLYAENKWVALARDVGAVDYLLIKSDLDENKSNEKLFQWLAANPRLDERQIALLIASKYNSPDEVKSQSALGYVYQLNDEDEEAIGNLFGELVSERLAELRADPEFKNASTEEQGYLMKDLYTQAREDASKIYGSTLDTNGRAMTLGRASAIGKEAFHTVLDTGKSVEKQAEWLGDMYKGDKVLNNPLHEGYELNLNDGDRRTLVNNFKAEWQVAYQELVNSDEFKNASRTYQENMIADRYNATAKSVEDAFAADLYRSGKYDETFGKPNGYSWGEAYTIAKGQYSDAKSQAEWLTQKYSTGTKIDNPDRAAYVITLTGAQQAEIKEDFAASFVPAYEKLVNSAEFKSLSRESQENRINDLQKKVTKEVEANYARKLITRGGYEENLDLNSSYEKVYTMLASERVSKSSAKSILKDKYEGGTITNPEAKEYRIGVYRKFIDDNFDKYIKNGTATEYQKLHEAAANAGTDAVKKKYDVKKLGEIDDLDYYIPMDKYPSVDKQYTTTYGSDNAYVIPPASNGGAMGSYGYVPKY